MAASDRLTGLAQIIKWQKTGAGSPTVINADATNFSYDRTLDTVDVTAGNETERYHKPTIEDMTWTLVLFDADQAYLVDLKPRTSGVMTVQKEGAGTGLSTEVFNALITGYSEAFPFDGVLEVTIKGRRQGAHVSDIGTVQ